MFQVFLGVLWVFHFEFIFAVQKESLSQTYVSFDSSRVHLDDQGTLLHRSFIEFQIDITKCNVKARKDF